MKRVTHSTMLVLLNKEKGVARGCTIKKSCCHCCLQMKVSPPTSMGDMLTQKKIINTVISVMIGINVREFEISI